MFQTNQKYISQLKAQFSRVDPEGFDKGMWQLCRAINKIPDIATSHCCSGHGGDEQKETGEFYITLHACSDRGEKAIASLYDWWCKFLGTQYVTEEGEVVQIHHTTKLEVCRLVDMYDSENVVWTYSLVALPDDGVNNSDRLIEALNKSIDRMGFLGNRKTA